MLATCQKFPDTNKITQEFRKIPKRRRAQKLLHELLGLALTYEKEKFSRFSRFQGML